MFLDLGLWLRQHPLHPPRYYGLRFSSLGPRLIHFSPLPWSLTSLPGGLLLAQTVGANLNDLII